MLPSSLLLPECPVMVSEAVGILATRPTSAGKIATMIVMRHRFPGGLSLFGRPPQKVSQMPGARSTPVSEAGNCNAG